MPWTTLAALIPRSCCHSTLHCRARVRWLRRRIPWLKPQPCHARPPVMHPLICCSLTRAGQTRGAANNERASAFVLRLVVATHNLPAKNCSTSRPSQPTSTRIGASANELRPSDASHCFEKIETEPKTTKSLFDCRALDTNGGRRSLKREIDSSSSLMSRARTCGLFSCFGHGTG
jgi:hypothetical protein